MQFSKRLATIGFLAGIASSLFGIGGGLIISPLLVMWLGFSMSQSAAQSITAVAPILMTSAIFHFLVASDIIEWKIVLIVAAGAIIGSHIGTAWLGKISNPIAIKLFSIFILLAGLSYLKLGLPFSQIIPSTVHYILLGLITGLCSGLFGIGGGTIMMPILSQLFGISFSHATGISILVALPVSIFTAVEQHFKTGIEKATLYFLIPSALIGVWVGYVLNTIIDVTTLKILFGCLMLVVGLRMFFFNQAKIPKSVLVAQESQVWWWEKKRAAKNAFDFYPIHLQEKNKLTNTATSSDDRLDNIRWKLKMAKKQLHD